MGYRESPGKSWLTRVVTLAAGLVYLSACGGGSSPTSVTPVPTPPPPPPPRTVLSSSAALAGYYGVGSYFTVDRVGALDVTVSYTFATSQIWVYLAPGQCTPELFNADQCTYLATSFAGPNPRRMSVAGAAAGTYTLIVLNGGPDAESIQYQVVLTPAASGSAGVTQLMASQPTGWLARRR